jgi:hypothetical protein
VLNENAVNGYKGYNSVMANIPISEGIFYFANGDILQGTFVNNLP